MRKIIFLMSVFFLSLFSSCKNFGAFSQEEIITLKLPPWPPEDIYKENYPPLYKWKITTTSAKGQNVFYNEPGKDLLLTTVKNQPLAVTAHPITLTAQGNKVSFFKQAGFLYPYNNQNYITWENGFLASIMTTLFYADSKDSENTALFIPKFNWEKASAIIREKSENESLHYNPWLLNRETILRKISSGEFSAVYLNLSSIKLIEPETMGGEIFISSYPPLNKSKLIVLKTKQPQDFMTSPDSSATITYISSKNISLDRNFLPILIEEYETK